MFELLDRIREKSESTKRRIAFLLAFFLVGLVFVVWLSVIYPDFKKGADVINQSQSTENSTASITAIFKNGMGQIIRQIGELRSNVKNFSTSPSYYNASSTGGVEGTSTSQI